MKPSIKLLLLFCLPFMGSAQNFQGFWEGAIIRTGNSVQLLEVNFFEHQDSLKAAIAFPDWPIYENDTSLVKVKNDVVKFQTPYGEAILVKDTIYEELIGVIGQSNPPLSLHLKRSIDSKNVSFSKQKLTIKSIDYTFNNYLYLPDNATKNSLSCVIIIPGRGCTEWYLYSGIAELLAKNGYAAFVYSERGSASSKVDCNTVTQEIETADLLEIKNSLSKVKAINPDKIGAFTSSAGAWTAINLSEKTNLAFLITYVGPTTSIKQQQYDGLKAFAKDENYSAEDLKDALEYTDLLFKPTINDNDLKRANELLKKAEQNGWINWLDDSDILKTKEDFKRLWVQRYSYDPTQALLNFKGPYLAMFGQNDPIVPYQIQINQLDSITQLSSNKKVEYRVIKNGTHGMNQNSSVRNLGYNSQIQSTPYYYKFFRVGMLPMIHTLEFLKKNKF